MKKEILVYIIIFILSFAVTAGFLFYMAKKQKEDKALVAASQKQIKTKVVLEKKENADSLKAVKDSLNQVESEFQSFVTQLKNLYSTTKKPKTEKELENIQRNVDSLLVILKTKVDSLSEKDRKNQKKIAELQKELSINDNIIRKQIAEIKSINNENKKKREEDHQAELNKQKEKDDTSLRELAKIYNKMDAKKVAEILKNMPVERATAILKRLNQKKIAQILAVLPPAIATSYSSKLTEN